MKLLNSADHHFDEHSRFEECVRVHNFQVELAQRERVDVYISSGDIYERASTPRESSAPTANSTITANRPAGESTRPDVVAS